MKQRNVQPIVTVRGSKRSFVCYPVGDDKLLLFYVEAPFDHSLRSASVTTSTDSLAASSSNAADVPDSPLRDDEVEADEMTKICADLQQLLVGVKTT